MGRQALRLLVAALGNALAAHPAPGTEVFVCRGPGQVVLYSQFPCQEGGGGAGGGRVGETLQLNPLQVLRVPPLNEGERQRLATLSLETERRKAQRMARRKHRMRDASRDQRRRLDSCSTARRKLEALTARRRKGYRANEVRELDARERALDAAVAENC
jgi:hypothetical protein